MIKEYQVASGVMAFSTTRKGGVSQGNYGEFNINEFCGDFAEHVAENRKRLAAELGVEETFFQKCVKELNENKKLNVQQGKPIRAINVGCMMPYMGYEPRTLKEILSAHE